MAFVELHCKSNFSFLEGASHADELFDRAAEFGYQALAITDRNSLSGIVRAHTAAKEAKVRLIVGAELHPIDGPPVVVWTMNRQGYANLCRIISRGRLRREKGNCEIHWQDIAELNVGLMAGLLLRLPMTDELPPADTKQFDEEWMPWEYEDRVDSSSRAEQTFDIDSLVSRADDQKFNNACEFPTVDFEPNDDSNWLQWLTTFKAIFADRANLLIGLHLGVDDERKTRRLMSLSDAAGVPLIAGGDVHYHAPQRALLQDCVTAIRFNTTIEQVQEQRLDNRQFYLRRGDELQRLYRDCSQALQRADEVAQQLNFSLDELKFHYPREFAPAGQTPIEYLKRLTWQGAKRRYGDVVPQSVIEMLRHEMALIEDLNYEAYFLTVWDLVRFARSRNILCQGRGSAANSIVCYCLGVTSVDPNQMDLLFERFISRERNEAPDIDVDFEHQRREEVLQYIYDKYGRHRAAMTATVTTYRIKSTIRDCGKSLGISLDNIDALSKLIDGRHGAATLADRCRECGIDPDSEIGKRFVYLVENLLGFPRHLSQHVGGMVITHDWLCELCPIENASMDGRTVIQWDKNDLDAMGILKVDCLSLGMLSAIHRAFDLLEKHYDRKLELATVPAEDVTTYDMICRADTIGVFQIESRAQMSMLPRLRPRCFYDLVIEVAIVRPGPIQGQMVHPYLKARQTGIQPDYPNNEIRDVLAKTMGVPIFQEQAMKLAVVAAGFTPGEADQLRRAMAAWRRPGVIDDFRLKLLAGMKRNGLDEEFADRVFNQIRGFGEYGFPESHAASFALLVYVSCWMKCHYPAAFCTALLNSQPMGFYAPSQLVRDAREHGVTVQPVDVNRSDWEATLEGERAAGYQIRLGLLSIHGLPEVVGRKIVSARSQGGEFRDLADFSQRTLLGQAMITRLADAGALSELVGDRRAAYWQSLAQDKKAIPLSLLDGTGTNIDDEVPEQLSPMRPIDEVHADYQTVGMSLRGHPIGFLRDELRRLRILSAQELKGVEDGRFVRTAGLVLIRQRPGTAKGITFVTLEDETGTSNLVIKQAVWDRYYKVARRANAWIVNGVLESREGIVHLIVGRIDDMSEQVGGLETRSRDFH